MQLYAVSLWLTKVFIHQLGTNSLFYPKSLYINCAVRYLKIEQDTIERVSVAQWFQLVLSNSHYIKNSCVHKWRFWVPILWFIIYFTAKAYPFRIIFNSDAYEAWVDGSADETGGGGNTGFKVRYFQQTC